MEHPWPTRSGRSRDSPHGRPAVVNDPPFNHSQRSCTDNGVHYTMQSARYTSPGLSFSAGGLFNNFSAPEERSRTRAPGFGAGIIDTAVNLLGAMGEMRHAPRTRDCHGPDNEHHVQLEGSDDESGLEDDLAYGEINERSSQDHRRSMFSRIKDRLHDNRQRPRKAPYSREESPTQRPQSRRQPSYREEAIQPKYQDIDDEYLDYEAFEKRHQRPMARPRQSSTDDVLQRLQHNVAHYHAQVRQRRKDLERASRQRNVDIGLLQGLLDQVKSSERSLGKAEQGLQAEQQRLAEGTHPSHRKHRTRPPPQSHAPPTTPRDFDNFFFTPDFGGFSAQSRAAQPLFPELDELHTADPFAHIFGGAFHSPYSAFGGQSPFDEDDLHTIFGMPSGVYFAGVRNKRPRFSSANGGPRSQPVPSFPAYTPPPPLQPPSTLLQPTEAEKLFRIYNDRWNALAPADTSIPYPARSLRAPALLAYDTLWAPSVSAPVTTWSEEAVMQANAQAFYLGVVGLLPQYSERGGRVTMGFDKTRASEAQVKQLVVMLKKEKVRWHSDRLGRRNGGRSGPNEALQSDPRARAIFHAVCELMETAQ